MIQNERIFREWEERWIAQDTLSLKEKFRILEGMYQEAKTLGIFPPQNALEGLDLKIRMARELNVRRAA